MNISNAAPAAGLLLVVALIAGALIPFEPVWFSAMATNARRDVNGSATLRAAATEIHWSPDGRRLMARSNGGTYGLGALAICDFSPTNAGLPRWSGIKETCNAVFSPDGSTGFFSTRDGELRRLRFEPGEIDELMTLPAGEWITALAVASDARQLALGLNDGGILLMHVDDGTCRGPLRSHQGSLACLAFSADGRRLVSTSCYGPVQVWDLDNSRRLQKFVRHSGTAPEAVFLDDGRQVLSCGRDGTLRRWDAASGDELWCAGGPATPPVSSLAVTQDETLAVTAQADGQIVFWDLAREQRLDRRAAHDGIVSRVRFSADDKWLASAGLDGRVLIWDVATKSIQSEFDVGQMR